MSATGVTLDHLAGPHLHSGLSPRQVSRAFLAATVPVVAAGLILFGRAAAGVLLSSIAGAALGEAIVFFIAPKSDRRDMGQALVTGVLVGLTLPVTVAWHIAFLGGLIALGVGKGLQGGFGNYLWHPALVGWAALQLLFGAELAPQRWPVLVRSQLVTGAIDASVDAPFFRGYQLSHPPHGVDAWALQRPIDRLIGCYDTPLIEGGVSESQWMSMFRDDLPPWGDTLWGAVGGAIGETSTFALMLGGLYLVYRGFLRRRSVVAALLTVAVLSAVLPVRLSGELVWFPAWRAQEHFPAGAAWVLFHLTGGGLLLSCLFFSADPMTTPLTARGHAFFGAGVGAVTMATRWLGLTPGGSFWAVLAMNTLVPVIDRLTRLRRPRA